MAKLRFTSKRGHANKKNRTFRFKRRSHNRSKKGGVPHARSTRPNVDTLMNLFSRVEIEKKPKPVKMTVEKDPMDNLTSMFSKLTGYKKKPKRKKSKWTTVKSHKK